MQSVCVQLSFIYLTLNGWFIFLGIVDSDSFTCQSGRRIQFYFILGSKAKAQVIDFV